MRPENAEWTFSKVSDFADKVVVLISGHLCGPCRQEMPELVKVSNDL